MPQLRQASGTRDDQDRVRLARVAMQLVDEIEIETGLAARRVASGDPDVINQLQDQRERTDAAREVYSSSFDNLGSLIDGPDGKPLVAVAPLRLIDSVRVLIDRGDATVDTVIDNASNEIDALHDNVSTLLSRTGDTTLLRRATRIADQLEAKSLVNRAVSRMAGRLIQQDLTEDDYRLFDADYQSAVNLYDEYRSDADAAGRQKLSEVEAVPEVGTLAKEADRIAAAVDTEGTYLVDPDEWWNVASKAVAGYDALDDFEFDHYLDLAQSESAAATRNTIIAIVAALLGAILAVGLAYLLGRNLSRRLQEVTDSAHDIAVDRLPEVLDSLRNPTPEALAGAIPKVESNSTDEIGSLADSFNTVLRTAVETSIEHSTRRAETLTNLLVNLGRRNQALLERQLKLIDTLEAREQDPGVLDGLFKLDHMVTRQRRNAESLLVLAGSGRSRSWSEPVPISDVIRGAISEVADMGRVDFEMPPGHDLLVTGAHAVDLSHLLAELIENATAYSSPSTTVQVRVQRNGLQVRVWVIDSGVGMTDDEIVAANQKVADPPDIDELTTDRVGFQVIGRLARRLAAQVRLQINPAGGVAAGVDLQPHTFEPLTGDLPIVAVAEAEARAAAGPAMAPSLVSDDVTLADLEAEADLEQPDHTAPTTTPDSTSILPKRGARASARAEVDDVADALPRRVPSTPESAITPLFGRSATVAEPAAAPVEPAVEPVADAESGLFRRLPGSGGSDGAEVDPAQRLRTLRAFSRGVAEGRQTDTPS